jgi:FAD/FMN-containing dehydrogenase
MATTTTKQSITFKNGAVLSIPELRRAFNGRLIAPGDPGYDQARTVFYGGIDRHPAAILRPADAGEVSRVIGLARETGLELAVRSGGHSTAGFGVTEGGIVLDLSGMKALQIDPEQCTAWAETGLTAGEYTTAAAAHALVTGFGDTGTVGIGGLTLGGGVGYLIRKYGLTIDDLLAAEIVTADGQILRTDASSHPDLFWAIRGGGGNFGVATRFQFRLHELAEVYGGLLILPATADTIAGFITEAENAPEELSSIATVMKAPPMPFLPPEVHGKMIVMAMLVYAGPVGAGEQALAPFRKLATPLADMVRPMRYPEIYQPEEAGYHPRGAARNMFVDSIDRSLAEVMLGHLRISNASMAVVQLRVMGGAMRRVPVDATAFAHRKSRIMVNLAALYQATEEKPVHEAWAENFAAALPQDDQGVYINFLGVEGESRLRAAYPGATWERLAGIKARYDPDNLFRLNQNIPPAN